MKKLPVIMMFLCSSFLSYSQKCKEADLFSTQFSDNKIYSYISVKRKKSTFYTEIDSISFNAYVSYPVMSSDRLSTYDTLIGLIKYTILVDFKSYKYDSLRFDAENKNLYIKRRVANPKVNFPRRQIFKWKKSIVVVEDNYTEPIRADIKLGDSREKRILVKLLLDIYEYFEEPETLKEYFLIRCIGDSTVRINKEYLKKKSLRALLEERGIITGVER